MIIGRVPFFFYVAHFWAPSRRRVHVVASLRARVSDIPVSPAAVDGRASGAISIRLWLPFWVAYLVWIGVVVAMYPLCRWYAAVKRTRRAWWLSYL